MHAAAADWGRVLQVLWRCTTASTQVWCGCGVGVGGVEVGGCVGGLCGGLDGALSWSAAGGSLGERLHCQLK
jgi:hypothetical protein